MNPDKINKWLEYAKNLTGNDFWSDIFEQQQAQTTMGQHPFQAAKRPESPALFPAVDILTAEDEMIVLVDLPGVDKQDVHISMNDEILFIKGEVKPLYPGIPSVQTERFSGTFERPIGLPTRVDGQSARVRAAFRQGTLVVRIPLAPTWKKPIDIE